MTEVWAPVPGWEGYYEVSTHGRVRGVERTAFNGRSRDAGVQGRVLSVFLSQEGYPCAHLWKSGKRTLRKVHTLVLTAFVGPRPDGMEACHENDVKADNRLENLRWDTKRANAADKRGNQRQPRKLSAEVVIEMRRLRKEEGLPFAEIAKRFGCSRAAAQKAISGKTYAWLQ